MNPADHNARSLAERLQDIEVLLRRHLASGRAPNLDTVAGLHVRVRDCRLIAAGQSGGDLMTYARSGAIGPKMGEVIDLGEALAREQRTIQAALDAGEDAEAACRSGSVVILPVVQRDRHIDDGDVA
jgi:hypothetical protein